MNRIIKFRAWDGDDSICHKDGEYTYVKAKWHPYSNKRGYVKRHRLVLEQKLGYYLPKYSIVHHINGNKRDDSIENLEYHPDQKFHAKSHDDGKRNGNGQFVAIDPIFQEIKFRLLNKHTGLYEVFTLGKLIKTTFRNSQFSFAGRFTGLHDKNGKEIYEGDIFRVEEDTEDLIYYLVVVWVKEWCMFCTLRVDDEYNSYLNGGIKALDEPSFWTYTLNDTNDRRFFLAGNIYQNANLLQV